jgi:hypothetical protein
METLADLNPQRKPKGAMAVRSSARLCENSKNRILKNEKVV